MLMRKKEELLDLKNEAEQNRETRRKDAQAKEEMAAKRIQQRLNRDKTQQVKDLLAQEEQITQANEDLKNKLAEEKAKHEKMLSERQDKAEAFKRKTEKKKDDTDVVAD